MLTIATRGGYQLQVEHEDDEFGVVLTPDGKVSPPLRVGTILAQGYWEAPLTAAGAFVEWQHPRHPSGSHEGGQWRSGHPVLDDSHVIPEIEEFVQGESDWQVDADAEKARLLDRYRMEYGPPIDAINSALTGYPDAIIQPQVNLDELESDQDGPSGTIAVRLNNGSKDNPSVSMVPDGLGGLSAIGPTPIDDPLAFRTTSDMERWSALLNRLTATRLPALTAAAYDETEHPRDPVGSKTGGRWRAKVGVTMFRPEDHAAGFYDSEKARDFEAEMGADAARYGVTIDSVDRVTGYWQGDQEPSWQLDVHDGEGIGKLAEEWRSRGNQDAVLQFDYADDGTDLMYVVHGSGPDAPRILEDAGVQGATIFPDRIEILSDEHDTLPDTVAAQLGANVSAYRGHASFVERPSTPQDSG